MTSRPNESSGMNPCTRSDARPNQVTMSSQLEEEGCPVIEESGAVCGETRTLRIFQEFRQIYDDCLRKMESNREENLALRKLAPFRKLVEDLWEQNAMLVETVEELEQEATNRVAMLQTKLDQCSEKDLENLLKQKDREICCLTKEVSNKNELLGKYYNQIDELKRDMKARNKKYMQIINHMKESAMERLCQAPEDLNGEGEEFNESAIVILFNAVVKEMDKQRSKLTKRIEEAEGLANKLSHEKTRVVNEKSDVTRRLEDMRVENCCLKSELAGYKNVKAENEELLCRLEQVKGERERLQEEVNCLNRSLQELDTSFKQTRWALTAEVAEKHDQVLELKRNLVCLEEQVRQADMKTLFKDGVIKEMRKELKNASTAVYAVENVANPPLIIPPVATDSQSWRFDVPVKENSDEDIKLDIRIFPIPENQETFASEYCKFSSESSSLEVQTEAKRKPLSKMRNVSTQHTTRVQKLPRSVGSRSRGQGSLTRYFYYYSGFSHKTSITGYLATQMKEELWLRYRQVYQGGMTPRGRLERLKQTLKSKMERMEDQDGTIEELECHLRRAKEDLARLKEKCDGKDRNRQSIELAKYEDKLKEFREILLGATSHLERVLRNMASCHDCGSCTCHRWAGEEGNAIHCIRKDLESLQIKRSISDSRVTCDSGIQTEDNAGERSLVKKSRNVTDMENFRDMSIAGVNALEEMKEQIDVLHELVKNYFKQMPSDHEKCQIEECENKFEKLREEFDGITETLSALLESLTSTQSVASDGSCSGRKQSKDESPTDKVATLKSEQKQLEKEICEQRAQLEKITNQLREAEMVLQEKKCQSEEQEKDLQSREEEITQLRAGVKGFRERLREMQIEIASEVGDKTMEIPEGSCSSLSILSSELQDLCDILTSSQSSFPGILEKCREENQQMKSTIACLEKCLENKEQTTTLLQRTLKLRDGQIDDLNCRIQSSEAHIEKLNKELCEKTRLIDNLQDSMRKAKEFEMKIKDECIAALQYEVCELDARLKAMVKEAVKKRKELEDLKDEILYVSSKNFFLNREIDLLEPKLGKMQKNLVLYETVVCELQNELSSRQCEIEELYEKVRGLEQELECETRKYEQQSLSDSERINELNATVRELRSELECVNSKSRKSSPIRSSRSAKRISECDETEDPCKRPSPKEIICQLRAEIKALKQRLKKSDEIKAKVAHFEEIIKHGECRQQVYNDEINELRKILEETVATHEREKEKLLQKLRKEETENSKNKTILCTINEKIKCKMAEENALKDMMKKLRCELESVESENEKLKSELENMKRDVRDNKDELDREELDKLISDLEAQKSDLKARCCKLKSELEKEEKIKKTLENRINDLNDMLSNKTHEIKKLSQDYKFTSAEAQEALAKLKDAEDRLKHMKMAMNKNQCDYNDEEGEDNDCEAAQRKELEDSLVAKTAECNNLMNEVECLQDKLKTVQNNYISAQANKDCELSRMNGEICRLESELDLAEKENCKLRKDIKVLQDELRKLSKREECNRDEIHRKEREINDLMCEKKALLESIDELQKRLEELCIDNTAKEKENRDLREQAMRMRKEMNEMEKGMCMMKQEFEALRQECSQTAEQLRCSEREMRNLKKLYKRAADENASLEEARCAMEKELCELKNERNLMKQKMQCARKQKEVETRKLMAENASISEEKSRFSCLIKDLNCKVRELEERVIPQLQEEIMRKNRCLEQYKMELCDANSSGQRMRDESLRVIQCTKKYLASQRNSNESSRVKSPCQKDNRYSNDNRDLEDQLKSGTCMNDQLYFDEHNDKNYQDTEPRSFSPQPWGCSNVERDNSSPEYCVESGFQSMQPSPTNMNYIEYGQDMKRTPSQWNNVARQMENQYSSCRNPSTR